MDCTLLMQKPRCNSAASSQQAQGPPDHVHTVWILVNGSPLHAHIIDTDLGIGYTAAEAGLRVGLVLDLAVAPGRTCRSSFFQQASR